MFLILGLGLELVFLELLFCESGSIWPEWEREGDQQLFFVDWPHSVVICNTSADGKH